MPMKMKIDKMYVYPVKALRAVELEEAQVTKHGFPHDRRFMMLHRQRDADGNITGLTNIGVGHYPRSVFFFPSIDTAAGLLTITYQPPTGPHRSLDLPLSPFTQDLEVLEVTMHRSPTRAYKMHQQYSDWFSSCYGLDVLLVYLGPHYRPVLMSSLPNVLRSSSSTSSSSSSSSSSSPSPSSSSSSSTSSSTTATSAGTSWLSSITSTASSLLPLLPLGKTAANTTPDAQLHTFNYCAPYLIASSKSMEDVTSRFAPSEASSLDIIKFRPNIIISGAEQAWDEDFWAQITIHSSKTSTSTSEEEAEEETSANPTKIDCIHNCGRCKSINIDYATGAPGTTASGELLKRLQKDRRVDPGCKYSPVFGRYSFLHGDSEGHVIRRGDVVEVSRRNDERTAFDWEGLTTLSSS